MLHTLNIRLFPEQLTYIANHAEDEVIFVDRSLTGLLWPLLKTFDTVRHIVVMDDGKGTIPEEGADGFELHDYEELLAAASPVEFGVDDENRAASMCYTSGTTGNPKGVVYSHRSTFLHTMGATTAGSLGASESDVILPVVPMFHANAWGLAHAAVACGATLVMPGPDLSGKAIADLIVNERVTIAAGVPTIWMGVLPELEGSRHVEPARDPVRRVGRAAGAVRGLPGAARHADPPGVGDDRDEPDRVGRADQVDARDRLRGGDGRPAGDGGARGARRRAARGRARVHHAPAVGRRVERRAAGAGSVDREGVLQRRPVG